VKSNSLTPHTLELGEVRLVKFLLCCANIHICSKSGKRPKAERHAWEWPHANEFSRFIRWIGGTCRREALNCHPKHPALDLSSKNRETRIHASKQGTDIRSTYELI